MDCRHQQTHRDSHFSNIRGSPQWGQNSFFGFQLSELAMDHHPLQELHTKCQIVSLDILYIKVSVHLFPWCAPSAGLALRSRILITHVVLLQTLHRKVERRKNIYSFLDTLRLLVFFLDFFSGSSFATWHKPSSITL